MDDQTFCRGPWNNQEIHILLIELWREKYLSYQFLPTNKDDLYSQLSVSTF